MQKDLLARDYDIPKKPIFLLDGKDIVQSTDSAAFVSNNVTDSIMYDTNGFIGLRHKSEVETACFATEVLLHGVYHSQTWEGNQSCSALPQERQIGASVCSVRLSCLVDGELGTISSIPHRRLSLEDGAFRSYSTDVTSSDGALVFDADYVRCVDVEDLSVWGEELTFHHFHSLRDRLEQGGVSSEVVSPNQCGAPSMSVYGGLGGGRAPPAEVCSTTKLEFCVSFIVDLAHWSVMETIEMDELLQRSTTSGLCIHSSTDVSCQVCYEDGANEMATPQPLTPVVDIASCTDDADHSGLVFERFPHTTVSAAARQLDADQEVYFGGRVDDHLGGARVSGASSSKCIITKRFVLPVADGCVPKQVIISLRARHMTFDPMLQLCTEPKPFHSLASILERRRSSLQEFWSLYDIDLQLHEELAPNRTRLALLYNAFRLFNVSYNIENGLSRSGCSCPGNGLMLDLTHYIFYGMCFTLTLPRAAMGLLKSLWHLLPQARRNAAMLYLRSGAVYPPHTFNGTSCTTVTAANFGRFHVNPEVGYLIHLYCSAVVDLSDEERLLLLELMLETARVWPQLGEWHENHTSFRIDNIAGADEYNNNNCGNFYIHVSAKCHMDFALQLVKEQESVLGTARVEELLNRLDLSPKELRTMGEVAQAMCMPQSNGHGIYTVHDTFDSLEQWSEERTKHPLSMNYHPLTIYRKKVIDIPEVLLGMLLYPKYFSKMDLERNTMYYRPLCTFDSPEGLAIMAVALCHARGNLAQPIPYLRSLSNLDLDNITYTAEQGLHLGAMSCSLLTLAWGMGGVSCGNNVLSLDPILPAGVARYSFTIHWRGSALRTSLDCDVILFELLSGDSLRFVHRPFDHRIHLHSGLRSCTARRRLEVPRALPNRNNSFDGAVFLCEAVFHNILEYSYVSWLRTLETLFESYRTLHNRPIPRLNPEEFIEAVAYEKEKSEIAYSGIHELLLKRGISLDVGTSEDAEIVETRYGLGNAKLAEMAEMLAKEKPLVNPDLLAMLRNFAQNGIAMAIVTYSRCLNQLLAQNPELADFFVARIDGEEAHNRKIQGRPHVDIHLRAAEKMHVHPSRCIVFSHHLDRDFAAPDLANFRMFLDVEDPFVSSRVAVRPYPTLSDEEAETLKRGNQVVCRLHLGDVPHTVEEVEDIIDGRRVSSANKVRQTTYF